MNSSLGYLRDFLIIAGVFLFFTGWIYIYYFYDYFGISLSLISIDYYTFIVYSFVVLISWYGLPLLVLALLMFVYMKWLKKYNATLYIILILFPCLFLLAKKTANDNAVQLRNSPNSMRQISFVFKDDAGFLAYKFNNDSLPVKSNLVQSDLSILKNTLIPSKLYLLGQNADYYFVLFQPNAPPEVKALPFGTIYFINKNNVLYSKITITSNKEQ